MSTLVAGLSSGSPATLRHMSVFAKVYTDNERDALEAICLARPDLAAPAIAKAASEGRLRFAGELVPAFKVPDATVRDFRSKAKKKADGLNRSTLLAETPGDAVENLRRRLVNVADVKLKRLEQAIERGQQHQAGTEEIRQVARAVREIAAIPQPGGRALGPKPGSAITGEGRKGNHGGPTKGGIAGRVLAAAALGGPEPAAAQETAQDGVYTGGEDNGQPAHAGAASQPASSTDREGDTDAPGSFASARIGLLLAGSGGSEQGST